MSGAADRLVVAETRLSVALATPGGDNLAPQVVDLEAVTYKKNIVVLANS